MKKNNGFLYFLLGVLTMALAGLIVVSFITSGFKKQIDELSKDLHPEITFKEYTIYVEDGVMAIEDIYGNPVTPIVINNTIYTPTSNLCDSLGLYYWYDEVRDDVIHIFYPNEEFNDN